MNSLLVFIATIFVLSTFEGIAHGNRRTGPNENNPPKTRPPSYATTQRTIGDVQAGCKRVHGTCGSECTQKGGKCMRNGTVCCHNDVVRDPDFQVKCKRVNGTCGSECTQKGGKCMRNGTVCCHNDVVGDPEDVQVKCKLVNGTCGSDCTQNGGKCMRNGTVCCHNNVAKDSDVQAKCKRVNGTCGSDCTQNGGKCMRNGTVCCYTNIAEDPNTQAKCKRVHGACGRDCIQNGGKCMRNETVCCHSNVVKDSEQEQQSSGGCMELKQRCGLKCRQSGGICQANGTKCCKTNGQTQNISKPEMEGKDVGGGGGGGDGGGGGLNRLRCVRIVGECGSKCSEAGGKCMADKCCFKDIPDDQADEECYSTKDKCNVECTGGRCKDEKTCCKITGQSGNVKHPRDDASVDEDSDDDDRTEDDGYINHKGMKLRCTSAKCTKKCSERRGGFCLKGKCCYKKTEREAQSRCRKERQEMKKEQLKNNGQWTNVEHLSCTPGGSYLARCQGKGQGLECHCLNVSSGERMGIPKKVATLEENIDCDKEQEKTKPERLRMKMKLSDKSLSEYSLSALEAMKGGLKDNLEIKFPVSADIELFEGSVKGDVGLRLCISDDCPATAQTTDLYSISAEVVSEINEGNIQFDVNGETIVLSDAVIKDVQTAEMLQGIRTDVRESPTAVEDKKMITVITVVAVAVVVLALGCAAAYYYSKKSRKLKKEKEDKLHVTKGEDNPSYIQA